MNSCSRPPIAWLRPDGVAATSPSGGVASRTLPDAFDLLDDLPDDEDDDAFDVPLARGAELDERVCFDAERFLDGPQVDMTLHTVPTGCHAGPRPSFTSRPRRHHPTRSRELVGK
jgi:hypothetical protein